MITKKTKLSLEYDGTTISVEFDNIDVDLDQYFQAFKTLMVGATYSEEQFNNWIISEGEVLSEDDSEIPVCSDASMYEFSRETRPDISGTTIRRGLLF